MSKRLPERPFLRGIEVPAVIEDEISEVAREEYRRRIFGMWDNQTDKMFERLGIDYGHISELKCECGGDVCGTTHSHWCPKENQ